MDPDDKKVWKLIHDGSEPNANLTDMMREIVTPPEKESQKGANTVAPSATDTEASAPEEANSPAEDPAPSEEEVTVDAAAAAYVATAKAPMRIREAAPHPSKGGNSNHSGFSPFLGIADLSYPTWTFVHPQVPA